MNMITYTIRLMALFSLLAIPFIGWLIFIRLAWLDKTTESNYFGIK